MTNLSIIPREVAHQKFFDALRVFVGRGRRWSCALVSEASGIPQRTIESYVSGQNSPSLENYQAICAVLGPTFFSATIDHLQFEVRSKEPGDITPQKLLSHALEFSTQLSQFLEDGFIDHTEKPKLKRSLCELNAQIIALETYLGKATR